MIKWTAIKAAAAGIAVLILAQIMFFGVLLNISHYELLWEVLSYSPGIAAFVTSYLAPKRKILLGTSLSVCGGALSIMSTYVYTYLGFHIDSIGSQLATFLILLTYCVIPTLGGSTLGYVVSLYKTDFK